MSNYYIPKKSSYPREKSCDRGCVKPHAYVSRCDLVEGNSIDVQTNDTDCEIRADIELNRRECIRIWGQILDCDGNPIADAQVKLLQRKGRCQDSYYEGIAHTVTDCLGYYQFDLCPEDRGKEFRIIVGKSVKSNDRVIQDQENCPACNNYNCIL